MSEEREGNDGRSGVQSLETGIEVLRALVRGQRAMMLKDIAAAAGMAPAKAHRYLVSLIRAGLVEQDAAGARYDLGPFAMSLGLAAIDRLDRVRLGLTAIARLRDEINETTALGVWGERGPVIVRWERPRRPITVNVVTGTQLRLLDSATGRVFAAWMPPARVAPIIAEELRQPREGAPLLTRGQVEEMLARVRTDGYAAISEGYFADGVEAVAAPVFNFKGDISMSLVVVGVRGATDLGAQGAAVVRLRQAANELSGRLGWTGSAGSTGATGHN